MPAIDSTIQLRKPPPSGCDDILSARALDFLAALAHGFEPRRRELLERRRLRQAELDAGKLPDFLPETKDIRERAWTVAPIPTDLRDRRVEITGPVDRKMMINGLNSGANVFMADFEDANAPTWENNVVGQQNLKDAVSGTISYVSPEGKRYTLAPTTATLFVRPRGWHLVEKHVDVDGVPISASLFDLGLAFYHNAAALITKGSGPYFYLPKLESHLEARLWNDVFSYIKKLRRDPERVLPDRARVTMEQPFLKSYAELVIRTCHRRGIHALGGMAAQIPIKRDQALNAQALEKVRQDKLREVRQGHDGTWVAHPALVPLAREVFDAHMPGPNQIERQRDDVRVTAQDLLATPPGAITFEGLRTNLDVAVRYLAAWLSGLGCVPINDLMEDAATAEISRAQVWQWQRHGARLQDGRYVNAAVIQQTLSEVMASLPERVGAKATGADQLSLAARILADLTTGADFAEFLTTVAYDYLD